MVPGGVGWFACRGYRMAGGGLATENLRNVAAFCVNVTAFCGSDVTIWINDTAFCDADTPAYIADFAVCSADTALSN